MDSTMRENENQFHLVDPSVVSPAFHESTFRRPVADRDLEVTRSRPNLVSKLLSCASVLESQPMWT